MNGNGQIALAPAAEQPQEARKAGKNAESRIKQLLSDNHEARQRIAQLEAQLAALRKEPKDSLQYGPTSIDELESAAYERGWNDSERWSAFKQTIEDCRRRYSDFDARLESLRKLPCSGAIFAEAESSPSGAEALYYLGASPLLLEELGGLNEAAVPERLRHFIRDLKSVGVLQ